MTAVDKNLRIGLGAFALAAMGLAAGAQADPYRRHAVVAPAPSSPARDGISGNSVGRANAHAGLGGPAIPKQTTISSVSRKQPH